MFRKLTGIAALAACLSVTQAHAQEVVLTIHHFLGPKAPPHTKFIEPWAKAVEQDSNGRIKIEIFPAMAMGGKPGELYGQVRDGLADIVWTLGGYTPGVFPRAEVFELPSIHQGSALATTQAIQDDFALIAEDFKDVHPLLVHVHAGNLLHMRDKRVTSPADLSGLKLRTPTRTGAWMIESWGAEPVGMPVPDVPQALSKNVIDGVLVPFEIVPALKLQELTAYSILGDDGSRFGTSVFLFLMNKERYEELPDDLKAVIDAHSGAAIAAMAGTLWDEIEEPGKKMQLDSGGEIVGIDAAAKAKFDDLSQSVEQRWIAEMQDQDIDGAALVEAAKTGVARHSQ